MVEIADLARHHPSPRRAGADVGGGRRRLRPDPVEPLPRGGRAPRNLDAANARSHQDLRLSLSLHDVRATHEVLGGVLGSNSDIAYLGSVDEKGKVIAWVS